MLIKVGLDLGNSTTKWATYSPENKIITDYIASKYMAVTGIEGDMEHHIDSSDVVEYNGKRITLGQGMSLNSIDKVNREFLEHQIIHVIYSVAGAGSHIAELALGLPISEFKTRKAELEERLSHLTTLNGTVNGKKVSVELINTVVCAEGYSSLISLNQKINKFEPTLIIDIGYKTTDTLLIRWSPEKKRYNVEKFEGIKLGLYDIYKTMSEVISTKGGEYDPEELDKRLNSQNPTVKTRTGTINLRKNLDFGMDMYKQIIKKIELIYGELYKYELLFTGGGSCVLLDAVASTEEDTKRFFSNAELTKVTPIEKYYSNAIGCLLQLGKPESPSV